MNSEISGLCDVTEIVLPKLHIFENQSQIIISAIKIIEPNTARASLQRLPSHMDQQASNLSPVKSILTSLQFFLPAFSFAAFSSEQSLSMYLYVLPI